MTSGILRSPAPGLDNEVGTERGRVEWSARFIASQPTRHQVDPRMKQEREFHPAHRLRVSGVEEDRLSYCRICAAACGIVVTVDGERVVRVRGDAEHETSRGYTCSKGRGIPAWHHSPGRLDHPRLHGADTSWDVTLDDLAAVMRATIDERGADAVALYLATGLAYDAAGQTAVPMLFGALGSGSFYTATTVDNAPVLVAAELVTGSSMLNPVWDPSSPGLLLLVGTNPVVSHGYGTTLPDPVRYLRDFRRDGGAIWVLDPRRTESAALADAHVAVRPGSDVIVLAALARAVLADGADRHELDHHCAPADVDALRGALAPFTLERAAAAADVERSALEALVSAIRAHPQRLAVFCGTGTMMSADGILVEWLRWVLMILSGSLDRPGGLRFLDGAARRLRPRTPRPAVAGPASRPELPRVARQMPAVALVDEIEAGNVRVLVVAGGNPIAALPEPARVRAALRSLDALAVLDVHDSELCELATHVLPATGQLERADLTLTANMSVRSTVQATAAIVAPVAERRPAWRIAADLGNRLGLDLLGGADPGALTDEDFLHRVLAHSPLDADTVLAAGPRGVEVPVEYGWVRDAMLPERQWQLTPPSLLDRLRAHDGPPDDLVLSTRRAMAWSNSVRYGKQDTAALVQMHPTDADAAQIADGALVRLTSAHGELAARVAIDPAIRPGVVSVTHGHRDASPGNLTSAHADVDPLTTMPRASGLSVSVSTANGATS